MTVSLRIWFSTLVATALAIAPCAAQPKAARAESLIRTPGRLFEFHSGFWLNLHHLLYAQARAAKGFPDTKRPAVAAAAGDTLGFSALPASERDRWRAALRYYGEHYASRDLLFDPGMVRLKNQLGDLEDSPSLEGSGLERGTIAALSDAAPAFRRLWWPRYDSANRAWVARVLPALTKSGNQLAAGVAGPFMAKWPDVPIRVDVTAYAMWAGAYTSNSPDRITISSLATDYAGPSGVEMLFHEALHTMDDSVATALDAEARTSGKRVPYDVTHALIFFTAGEMARRVLPDYQPYAYRLGIWTRGSFATYLPVIQRFWLPYLDGRLSFDSAINNIVERLTQQ